MKPLKTINLILLISFALLFSACTSKYSSNEVKQKKEYRKHSTLQYVVQDPNKNELMYLLQNGPNIKAGKTIEIKKALPNNDFHPDLLKQNDSIINTLMTWGSLSINSIHFNNTILKGAIISNNLNLIKYLIQNDKVDSNLWLDDTPPLILAASRSLEITKYLIENNTSLYIRDEYKKNALDHAKRYNKNDIVQYLISKGINKKPKYRVKKGLKVKAKSIRFAKTLDEAIYLKNKRYSISKSYKGETPLMTHGYHINKMYNTYPKYFQEHMKIFRFLMDSKANLNTKNSNGLTLKDLALKDSSYYGLKRYLQRYYPNVLK
ncbi:ankyrin repeat domain-containing protein [Arcobacter peruensis]|uniref:ankyrin repeat domain-containing protein n=1 Tax=Arcobacter peruensis TaxID=2320140 RepID=UPI000F08E21D|nr:ankyrin repeat domain-containing protein [Arcobacter peruensis]